jgi:hypothetical protein
VPADGTANPFISAVPLPGQLLLLKAVRAVPAELKTCMHGQKLPLVELVVRTVKLRTSFAFAEKV